MRIFLTGATGFVGYHVAKAMAAEGADLRLLVRKSSNLRNLEGLPGDTVTGDLADPASLRAPLAGVDAVVHVAADYRLWIPDPHAMYRANVEGTRELLRLAREAGVPRFVYTSSVATMHFFTDGRLSDEDTPVSLDEMVGHYKRSKFMAEQEALKAAQSGQQVMILNPTSPVGPHDVKPTPTGRIFVDFLNGKFPAYVDTGLNLVDVAEVARAHVLALTRGTAGRRYILGGENLTLKQILDRMAALTGIPAPSVRIPLMIAATYAFFEEWITGHIRGREPRATLEEVRMGRKKMFVSSARAEHELGFRVLPVEPALRSAIEWFRAHGYASRQPGGKIPSAKDLA
jgi:dihydroflavonol-4-reductase